MVVGSGDIASVLPDRDDLTFFASGVSNSREDRDNEFARELHLLLEQPADRHIVYFSSLAVFYSDTPYTQHKLRMEAVIRERFKTYTIVRLGNITWGSNPHTIINTFRKQYAAGEDIVLRSEYRYLVDLEEFLHWINMIPNWSCEMNVTGRMLKVEDIFYEYVKKQN